MSTLVAIWDAHVKDMRWAVCGSSPRSPIPKGDQWYEIHRHCVWKIPFGRPIATLFFFQCMEFRLLISGLLTSAQTYFGKHQEQSGMIKKLYPWWSWSCSQVEYAKSYQMADEKYRPTKLIHQLSPSSWYHKRVIPLSLRQPALHQTNQHHSRQYLPHHQANEILFLLH